MFADPLLLNSTYDGQDFGGLITLPCISRSVDSSSYRTVVGDDTWTIFQGHQYGRRNRFTRRVTIDALLPDPIDSSLNARVSSSFYLVADLSVLGLPTDFAGAMIAVAAGALFPSSAATSFHRILNGET